MKRTIRLKGMNGPLKGQTWEATDLLRRLGADSETVVGGVTTLSFLSTQSATV